jgi:hypothetical protein
VSGRESGRTPAAPHAVMADPDVLEVAPGAAREKLQGSVPQLATPDELCAALEQAFDYRGDVRITRKDGVNIEGYVFDRRNGKTLEDSIVRLLPKDGGGKVSVRYADIAALAFTGRDMAAGNSWESWVRQYWTKKSAGESDISLQPENLE